MESGDHSLVRHLKTDPDKAPLGAQDRAMIDFALKLTRAPDTVKRADLEFLQQYGFSEENVVDIVLITCVFNFMNRLADGLGVEIDPQMQHLLDANADKELSRRPPAVGSGRRPPTLQGFLEYPVGFVYLSAHAFETALHGPVIFKNPRTLNQTIAVGRDVLPEFEIQHGVQTTHPHVRIGAEQENPQGINPAPIPQKLEEAQREESAVHMPQSLVVVRQREGKANRPVLQFGDKTQPGIGDAAQRVGKQVHLGLSHRHEAPVLRPRLYGRWRATPGFLP